MEKQDVMYVVVGLVIILIVALVIKPVITGHPVNVGFTSPTTPPAENITVTPYITPKPTITTVLTTQTPVPISTYGNGTVITVNFVNPETYHLSQTPQILNATHAGVTLINSSLTTIATISGNFSGATQVINIPFPYWEMWYTADPAGNGGKLGTGQVLATTTYNASRTYHTVIQGSFSVTYPSLSIQVMDAGDPNRIVRTVEPPGGLIDSSLWQGSVMLANGQTQTLDPRPWIEKFYEGQRGYYFIIQASSLNSYQIDIRVPTRYIGKY